MAVLFATAGHARVPDMPFLGLIAAACGIALVSYYDDVRSWPFAIKLAAQLAAALVAIACGIRVRVVHLPWGALDTGWLGIPLTAAWIVFATNAVNFIDGLNGLASGSVAIACLFLGGIALAEHDGFVQVAALVLSAGIMGFLPYNFPRARIFMGDVGSQFCGFVVASLGVLACGFGAGGLSALLVPMLLFGVVFDVVFTLLRRCVAGERLTEAHRGHLYQVAHRSGMPAWTVTLIYWGMAAWNGLCCLGFEAMTGAWKLAVPALVAIPPILWLATVIRLARRAEIKRW
jgi:UDP-GlcNAc:undecaprenyl-phosphate GlcNAc-1-phosphate transferase